MGKNEKLTREKDNLADTYFKENPDGHICVGCLNEELKIKEISDMQAVHSRDKTGDELCKGCMLESYGRLDHKQRQLVNQEAKEKGVEMEKNLIVKDAIVMPMVSPEEAVAKWQAYQDLKKKIVESIDRQKIGNKEFLKKSYWRKLATFFNLSVEIVEEKSETLVRFGQEVIVYHFRARAIAPNGRFAEATGSCDIFDHATIKDGEFKTHGYENGERVWKQATANSIHNTRTTAETRAWNRAVSNLVGGGEVSAEEVTEANVGRPNGTAKPQGGCITEAQGKRLYAIWKGKRLADDTVKGHLKEIYGIESTKEILRKDYEDIVRWVESQ